MSDLNTIIMPSAVVNDISGEVPGQPYVLRIVAGKEHVTEKSGNRNIEVTAEIIYPDVANTKEGKAVNVAGRKARMYIPLSAGAKNFDNWEKFLTKLQLCESNGGFIPQNVIDKCNKGDVFFQSFVFSEPDMVKHPVTGEPVFVNGQPIVSGHRTCLIDHTHIFGRCPAPAGFEAPKF